MNARSQPTALLMRVTILVPLAPVAVACALTLALPQHQTGLLLGAGLAAAAAFGAMAVTHTAARGSLQQLLAGFGVAAGIRFPGRRPRFCHWLVACRRRWSQAVLTVAACVVVAGIADAAILMQQLQAQGGVSDATPQSQPATKPGTAEISMVKEVARG